MKQLHRQSLFLIITILLILANKCYGQDLLDKVKNNSKLIIELKDTYRAFHINSIIIEQKEMFNIMLENESDEEMKNLFTKYITVCNNLKKIHFNNQILNSHVNKYLSLTIQNYTIAQKKGFKSTEFKKDFEKYKKVKNDYMNYLSTNYSTNHFISLTEEKYWQINNKNNYIKSSEYSKYKSLNNSNLKEALILLEKIAKETTNFQEYSIYQIELADQYVKKSDSLEDNANEIAIAKYKEILDQKKYSIYLFESWLKWRMVNQQHKFGISKTSDIPNNFYDNKREEVASTILEFITNNENDEMAINEFLLMATHPIVMRFGEYPYGNQNTIEYHETFDEKK